MSLPLVITDAGRAALVNATNTGTLPLTISQVGVSASTAAVDHTTTALDGEIKRLATFGGQAVDAATLHISIGDESQDAYSLYSFGLYFSDGTLFGVYSQADVILEKTAASTLLLACDVALADISATDIAFGATDFLNPPATQQTVGVLRFATQAEALAGADPTTGISPATLEAVLNALLPRGSIIEWYGSAANVPAGWHICDGTNGTPNLVGKFTVGAAGDTGAGTAFDLGSAGGSATMTVTVQGHALTVAELPSYDLTVTDYGHNHTLTDGGHAHAVAQSPHGHGVTDPGHNHSYGGAFVEQTGSGVALGGGGGQFSTVQGGWTDMDGSNISIQGNYANVSIDAAYSGVGIEAAKTGIVVGSGGSGQAHAHGVTTTTNLPPYVALYKIMKL